LWHVIAALHGERASVRIIGSRNCGEFSCYRCFRDRTTLRAVPRGFIGSIRA
jgi:hypothetical protein